MYQQVAPIEIYVKQQQQQQQIPYLQLTNNHNIHLSLYPYWKLVSLDPYLILTGPHIHAYANTFIHPKWLHLHGGGGGGGGGSYALNDHTGRGEGSYTLNDDHI